MSDTKLTLVKDAQDFFRELLTRTLVRKKIKAKPETELYLIHLLNDFLLTDRLYRRDQNGKLLDEPLVMLMKEALDEQNKQIRSLLFRQIGDLALYLTGFFQENITQRNLEPGYFCQMGEAAYDQASSLEEMGSAKKAVFLDLSQGFSNWVEVLGEISIQTTQKSEPNIIKVYERWLKTQSSRAAQTLKASGIIPKRFKK